MSRLTSFRKMNGLGNDFVVLDLRRTPLALGPEEAAAIADRNTGIGCDQVIAIAPSDRADVLMRIWNADGGEVGACGNAARCVAGLIAGERGSPRISIETEGGLLQAVANGDGSVTIDMGAPRFDWAAIPLAERVEDTSRIPLEVPGEPSLRFASAVNVGNPHIIFFVDSINAHNLPRFGPMLERHPLFPERANVSLAEAIGPASLRLRTWERGAGLTKACGTAACAAAIAAARRGLAERKVRVLLPGGELGIDWREEDDHILMTGPYSLDCEGELPPELLHHAGRSAEGRREQGLT